MARHLAKSVKDVDYYFFISGDINTHKKEFLRLVASVDIVHWLANLSWVKLPPEIDIRKFDIPNIAAIHHVDENLRGYGEKEEAIKVFAASICDAIQVESKEWVGIIRSKTSTPVFLAHQAINAQDFKPNRINGRPRNPYQIGTFGFAREMTDRKRLDVLLHALCILQNNRYNFELVVQGSHWGKLQSHFINQGIRIRNLGFLSLGKALKSYRYLDLYVCSSDIEGGPLPVLEALASKVPVVSTRVGVAIEALSMGGGILVDKGNPEKLATAIADIMDNPTLYQRLSQEAIDVAEKFSWDNIGKEYIAMYQYALDIKKPSVERRPLVISANVQRSIQLLRSALYGWFVIKKNPSD